MSEQKPQVPATTNKVKLTASLIDAQPNAKALLELPAIEDNWVQTYSKLTGRSQQDASVRFQAEKILFLQTIDANDGLKKADNFSKYTSFFELAISGGTLRDGLCYIVPFKGKAQFLPGWKFRLEQINENPDVVFCHQPVVVYDCDEFEFEMGMHPKITVHKPAKVRPTDAQKTHVYWVIEFTKGAQVYIMNAAEVIRIRDTYSPSYKEYKKKKAAGQWQDWMELPMWIKDEEQAFQKTIVKQTWKHLPKLPKHKWLDERLKATGINDTEIDQEDFDYDKLLLKEEATNAGNNTQSTASGQNAQQGNQQGQGGSNNIQGTSGNDGTYTEYEEVRDDSAAGSPGSAETNKGSASLKDIASNPNEGF